MGMLCLMVESPSLYGTTQRVLVPWDILWINHGTLCLILEEPNWYGVEYVFQGIKILDLKQLKCRVVTLSDKVWWDLSQPEDSRLGFTVGGNK